MRFTYEDYIEKLSIRGGAGGYAFGMTYHPIGGRCEKSTHRPLSSDGLQREHYAYGPDVTPDNEKTMANKPVGKG